MEEQIQGISALTEKRSERCAAQQRLSDLQAQAKAKEDESKRLTEAMEARTKAKENAISRATMPIPALGFGDGLVLYQGIPFEQASSAEQLRVSTAIAMAANPKLKVIRITDGSLLDSDSLAMLHAMAEENGFQVWLEVVSDSKNIGVVISDGEVVADNQAAELGLTNPQQPIPQEALDEAITSLQKSVINTDDRLDRRHAQGLDLDIP